MVEPSSKRRYGDACGAAYALELIGERWALLVMRELMYGPKRFGELRAGLPGISANVLTQRLEGLEAERVLVRRRLPPPASFWVYELTDWGREAEPIIQELGRWATRSPGHDPTQPLSSASLMMSMRTMIDLDRAGGFDAHIGFRIGEERFLIHVTAEGVQVERREPRGADLIVTGTPPAIAAVLYGGAPLDSIGIEGDRALAERFATLFVLPPKAW